LPQSEQEEHGQAQPLTQAGSKKEEHAHSRRLLVVEDNPVNQKVVLHQVEKLGYQAQIASGGARALELLDTHSFDLILMDCQMPGMDGYETVARIRANEQRLARPHMPIVAMTASALNGDRQKCLDAGMDDYLTKPVELERLGLLLEKWSRGNLGHLCGVAPAEPADGKHGGPVVDMASLRRVVGDGASGEAAAAEIYVLFKAETPRRLQGLADSLRRNDPVQTAARAHALQGGCLAVGAKRMGMTCATIVKLARKNELGQAAALLQGLWKDYEETLDFFAKGDQSNSAA
jgi:CheY-like chemotaxis protein